MLSMREKGSRKYIMFCSIIYNKDLSLTAMAVMMFKVVLVYTIGFFVIFILL